MRCGVTSGNVIFLCLILSLGLKRVRPVEVSCPAELGATKGDNVTLRCTFWSHTSTTSSLSVDWSFRPESGGVAHTFFHFFSVDYPPREKPFVGRVKWVGNPRWSDVSIQLLNVSLNDNGTYTCAVRNPPDVHGAPAHIRLTVTPRGQALRFTDVAVLLALVLLPSAVTALILLVRLCCLGRCCCSPRRDKPPDRGRGSLLKAADSHTVGYRKPTMREQIRFCCHMYLQDPDFDEFYIHNKTLQAEAVVETVAESQC